MEGISNCLRAFQRQTSERERERMQKRLRNEIHSVGSTVAAAAEHWENVYCKATKDFVRGVIK